MSELTTHLAHIKEILRIIYSNTNKILDIQQLNPTSNYNFIHIDYNQKYNSGVRYPPILVSNDFSKLYTNVGIMDTLIELHDVLIISKLTTILKLERYNHTYYSVHIDTSSSLENYYSPIRIMEEWVK